MLKLKNKGIIPVMGADMLAGLRTAAAGLKTATATAFENRRTINPAWNADFRRQISPRSIPAPASTPPPNVYSRDTYGRITDPSGRTLFYDPTGRMDIAEDGILLEDGAPIGFVSIYDAPGPHFSTDNILSIRLDTLKPERMLNQIIGLRAFQANAAVVRTADEMLGTVIDMVG